MTENIQKDVRTKMLQALSKYNIKQVQVARQAGIHHSTLSLWLQGKVKGHHIKIEDTLNEWLDSLYSGRPRYTTLNKTIDKQFLLNPNVLSYRHKRPYDGQQIYLPVHFDFELENHKYKQQFCWNINQLYFTPQQFAHLIVEQNTNLNNFQWQIVDIIRKTINSYRKNKIIKSPCLKILQLDVKIDNLCLKDRFQWDISDQNNNPQNFAYQLVNQLNLNNQFMVKIAYQIRQQIQYHRNIQLRLDQVCYLDIKKSTKNLICINDGGQIIHRNIEINNQNYIRQNIDQQWQPKIEILDDGEIRKFQKLQQRQNRYARRTIN